MTIQELFDSAVMFKLCELWDFSQKEFVNIWLLKIQDHWLLQCGAVFWNDGLWDSEHYSKFESKEYALKVFYDQFGWVGVKGGN
jgi:hypothetical protein